MKFSIRRVWGVMVRHLFNFRHTWDRITDAFYWPVFDIIVWGLTIAALKRQGQSSTEAIAMILIAVVLWYVLWRGQYEITVNFLEELWSDNFGNLFSTPLTLAEWLSALLTLGFVKLFLTVSFTASIAYLLYAVNIFSLGWALVPIIASLLMTGWVVGLSIASLFLRWGTKVQTLAWVGGFILMPFSAVYYPLATLPVWMQKVSAIFPSTYAFEGMRIVLATGRIPWGMLGISLFLNVIYLCLAVFVFLTSFTAARENGLTHIK